MSDDRFLGFSFFVIPRRAFATLAALVIALYGLSSSCYIFIFEYMAAPMERTIHCHGPGCNDTFTCQGMEEASFHTVIAIRVVGSLLFGCWGIFGAIHGHVSELRYLSVFLFFMAATIVVAAACDKAYMSICNVYPWNVISEGLIWMYPGLPISDIMKRKIVQMETYNIRYLNALTGMNIWHVYLMAELPVVLLWAYAAHEVAMLARLNAYGMVGLGANFSIQGWRQDVILKNKLRDDLLSANELARANARDVGRSYGPRGPGAGKGIGGVLYGYGATSA